ncbi:MAG TPA: ATP-binding protein [Gammaproteobacteria bacterium]|nr:ATP-binding protein [Gammaproteobacteria bacterium]
MTKSIQRYLIISVLATILLVCGLSVIITLSIKHDEVKPHLDAQLAYAALTLDTLANLDSITHHSKIENLQNTINSIPQRIEDINYSGTSDSSLINSHIKSIQFQIIKHGKLILHSPGSPTETLDMASGYGYYIDANTHWRVFTLDEPSKSLKITVLQPHDLRLYYETRVAYTSVLVITFACALLMITIIFFVNRSVSYLQKIAHEIKNRDPNNLKPIETTNVPQEILSMIDDLNRLLHQLKLALDREKSFAGNAAHELRTPLTTLKIQAQLALSSTKDNNIIEILNDIVSSIDQQTHVVSQLLTLSRMMPESLSNHQSKININCMIQQQILAISKKRQENECNIIHNEIDDLFYLGHEKAIETALRNILDNAITYCPKGSTITIDTHHDDDAIYISIQDNGPGITDEFKPKVMERFFRVLGTNTSGTGLGLHIVKQIVEFHHGKIDLLDNYPQGLNVVLSFPKSKGQLKDQ